ncbi:MAG: RNase H family protein [Terracidiphilus sp.]
MNKQFFIFTDGSAIGNPGPAGWAAIVIHGTRRQEIAGSVPWSTVSEMELRAAVEALRSTECASASSAGDVTDGATAVALTCNTRNCGASCSC